MKVLLVLLCFFCLVLSSASAQEFTSSNLPIVVIETNGQFIPDEPKIDVDMGIIYNGPGQTNYMTDPFNEYDGMVGIEKRGSSSQAFFPKKQYAIETRDSLGNNLNVSILGLPEENDWILHAPYSDKTFMRNVLTYKLAGEMGYYSSRSRYVELVLNGDYQGIYVILEKIKRDANRVDISEMDEDDIQGDSLTGGYIVKIDKMDGAFNEGWSSQFPPYPGAWQEIFYQYHYPKQQNIQIEQELYIQQFIYEFESVMNSPEYNNPETGYASIVNFNSFVDLVLVNELTKNVDAYRLSTYFTKDRNSKDGRLSVGPVWDYNIALGNADYFSGYNPEGWMINAGNSTGDYYTIPFWWEKFMEDPAFYQQLVLRWNVFRNTILHTDSVLNFIDQTAALLEDPQQRNFERWPILGEWIWPNYFVGDTYEEEVNYLKGWINSRFQWMDEELRLQPIITELNYQSSPTMDAGDWLELYNPLDQAIELSGWKLKRGDDVYYEFPSQSVLPSNSYQVVCEDVSLFESVYPDVVNVYGNMFMDLGDTGDEVSLYDAAGNCVDMLTYHVVPSWPIGVAGTGNTIELIYYLTDNSKGENWQVSEQQGGSPGEQNTISMVPALYINELMADNDSVIHDEYGEYDDWIEVYNASETPVNIGGRYFTDDLVVPLKYQVPNTLPEATKIPPGGFLLLWADGEPAQGVLHLDFKLSQQGEQVGIFMADGSSLIDSVSFGALMNNKSYGRVQDGGVPWTVFEQPTPGVSNVFMGINTPPDSNLEIYPNPASQWIHFSMESYVNGSTTLEIIDMMGMLKMNKTVNSSSGKINLKDLQAGIYFIVLRTENDVWIERFIKH